MAGNITALANTGTGTDVLATDLIGGAHYARTKIALGADGAFDGDVSASNPLPVTGPLTNAQLRASDVPVSLTTLPATTNAIGNVGTRDLTTSTYNVAGVIAINTDLLTIDCLGLRSLTIQCTSMGTTGVVTPAWSADGTTFVNTSLTTGTGTSINTFNGAGLWITAVSARYFRLRLTTATTAGTTTLLVQGSALPLGTQISQGVTIAGTPAVTISGTPTVTATPATPTANILNSAATTNGTIVKASAGTLYGIVASNTGASIRYLKLHNSTTVTVGTTAVALTIPLPIGGIVPLDWGPIGMRFGTGICLSITGAAGDTDTTAIGAGEVKVLTSYI